MNNSLGKKLAKWIANLSFTSKKQNKLTIPFLDQAYYQKESRLKFSKKEEALQHFLTIGWQQGFSPNSAFSVNQYLSAYPDIKDAEINPLVHYLKYGWQENRQAFSETGEVCDILGYKNGEIITLGERPTYLTLNWTECTKLSGSISYPPLNCKEILLESEGELIGIAKLQASQNNYEDFTSIEQYHFTYYLPNDQRIETIKAKINNTSLQEICVKNPNFDSLNIEAEEFIHSKKNNYSSAIAPCSRELIRSFIKHKLRLLSGTHTGDRQRVSIIMPVYNREHLVRQAIKSIAQQTYKNWELIFIDDGSSDKSITAIKRALKEYQIEHKSQLIVLPTNKGVSHARNQGLKASKAPLIAYLDSDNSWDKHYLELITSNFIAKPQVQSIYTGQYVYFYNQLKQKRYMAGIRAKSFNRMELEKGNYIDLNSYVHKKDLYEKLGGFNEDMRRLVDWDLILRYSANSEPLFIPALLARYNLGIAENQITQIEDYKSNFNQIFESPKKAF